MPPKSQGWLRQVCLRGSGTDKRLREFQEKGVEPSNWKAGSRHLTQVAFLCPRQPNLWGFISWLSRKRCRNRWCRQLRAFLQRPWKGSRAQNVGRLPQTLLSPQALTLLMPPLTPLRAPKRTWLICTQKESHSGLAVTMKPERLGEKTEISYTRAFSSLWVSGLRAPPLIPQSFHKQERQPSTPQPWESFIRWKEMGCRGQNGKLRLCLSLEPLPNKSSLFTSSNSFTHSSINKYFLNPSSPPGQ